jgi:glyoxylase-like metal-dependent hydrolase (beta-lactamase superfamily II)
VEFASRTLPPFGTTWVTFLHHGSHAFIIDPGFSEDTASDEAAAFLDYLGVSTVQGILITHADRDHVDGLADLRRRIGADLPVSGHPDALAVAGLEANARQLHGGDVVQLGDLAVTARDTPGHAPGHLCFELPDSGWIAGDLITGRGPSYVGLHRGNATAYERSLQTVIQHRPAWLAVSHGPAVRQPRTALLSALTHRKKREQQLRNAALEPRPLEELVATLYPSAPPSAVSLLERSVLAYLEKLIGEGTIINLGATEDGPYQATPNA